MSLTHRCMLGNCSSHGHTDCTPCQQSLVGTDTAQSPRHSCCQQIPQWPSHRHMLKLTPKVGHQKSNYTNQDYTFLISGEKCYKPCKFQESRLTSAFWEVVVSWGAHVAAVTHKVLLTGAGLATLQWTDLSICTIHVTLARNTGGVTFVSWGTTAKEGTLQQVLFCLLKQGTQHCFLGTCCVCSNNDVIMMSCLPVTVEACVFLATQTSSWPLLTLPCRHIQVTLTGWKVKGHT